MVQLVEKSVTFDGLDPETLKAAQAVLDSGKESILSGQSKERSSMNPTPNDKNNEEQTKKLIYSISPSLEEEILSSACEESKHGEQPNSLKKAPWKRPPTVNTERCTTELPIANSDPKQSEYL